MSIAVNFEETSFGVQVQFIRLDEHLIDTQSCLKLVKVQTEVERFRILRVSVANVSHFFVVETVVRYISDTIQVFDIVVSDIENIDVPRVHCKEDRSICTSYVGTKNACADS